MQQGFLPQGSALNDHPHEWVEAMMALWAEDGRRRAMESEGIRTETELPPGVPVVLEEHSHGSIPGPKVVAPIGGRAAATGRTRADLEARGILKPRRREAR